MNKIFLQRTDSQKFSKAEIYLANRLRTLRTVYKTEEDFIKHMTTVIDGIGFIKSEAHRLYKAMQTVKFWNGAYLTGIDREGALCFKKEQYTNGSNFFEEYAHSLLEEGDIIQPRGRKPGISYPRKKISPVEEIITVEESTEDLVEEGSISLLKDASTEELINELLSRANILSVHIEYGQII